MQEIIAVLVLNVWVCPRLHQQLEHIRPTRRIPYASVERGRPLKGRALVDRDASLDQPRANIDPDLISIKNIILKETLPIFVFRIHPVGNMLLKTIVDLIVDVCEQGCDQT
jgi:hypothetical protein